MNKREKPKIAKIVCPNCGYSELSDALKEMDYTLNYDGSFSWHCFECDHEWKGNWEGK